MRLGIHLHSQVPICSDEISCCCICWCYHHETSIYVCIAILFSTFYSLILGKKKSCYCIVQMGDFQSYMPTLRDGHFLSARCITLRLRHNGRDGVSNHQPRDCFLNRLFRRSSKKTSKLRVTGLCVGNSPGAGEFPAQMASNAVNVSIWWRHHDESWWWYWVVYDCSKLLTTW